MRKLLSRLVGAKPPVREPGIAIEEFAALVYGGGLDDAALATLRNGLGKARVETVSDMRALGMMLDRQRHPTPLGIQFAPADIMLARVNGIEAWLDRHDVSVSVPSAASGEYEPHIVASLRRIVRPDMTAFDIGANVGLHALLLAELVGNGGKVVAFEPNPENCRLIRMSADHHGFAQLSLLPVALSDEQGWVFFTTHLGSNGGMLGAQALSAGTPGTVVPTFRLDDLVLPRPDLIKIDIEGGEYRALKGGEDMLRRARPAILCEYSMEMTHRVSCIDPVEFLRWIGSLDYRVSILDRVSHDVVPVESIDALVADWGSHVRIEDLLLLPAENGRP